MTVLLQLVAIAAGNLPLSQRATCCRHAGSVFQHREMCSHGVGKLMEQRKPAACWQHAGGRGKDTWRRRRGCRFSWRQLQPSL